MAAGSAGDPPTPMVEPVEALAGGKRARSKPKAAKVEAQPGSLLHVASGLIRYEESRVRDEGGGGRVPGTITYRECLNKKKAIYDFLGYLNERNGHGAVARMHLTDLTMQDVEAYNRHMVERGFTVNTLRRKMQVIKRIIDRAGRPEYGQQVLDWNWDSLDRTPGRASKHKKLPTLEQVQKLLTAADTRGRAIIWLGIGLGFGQSDLSAIRVDDIDQTGYDLRRGKTGIDRYGDTPPGVWRAIDAYMTETPRQAGDPLFVTKNGQPLVHTKSDSILQWWNRLRESIGETKESLDGFYVLRHLGATEFGSRDGCSISAMKR
ncbi:MAG: site-specific integrase [Phycisphaerae bacterium]|nr:site-specific integrase [Phycisphaerae bacterium]